MMNILAPHKIQFIWRKKKLEMKERENGKWASKGIIAACKTLLQRPEKWIHFTMTSNAV